MTLTVAARQTASHCSHRHIQAHIECGSGTATEVARPRAQLPFTLSIAEGALDARMA